MLSSSTVSGPADYSASALFTGAKLRRWCSVAPSAASRSVEGGRVAFMLRETVVRELAVQLGHFAIARDLCQNGRRADLRHAAVALHHRLRTHRQVRATVTVD